ncbi:hypothetical protein HN840_01885 [archaeon]|jgi:hypothetical protein|nr:hypothetical protein [archaeon]MBT3730494.1 hypothetical protein [archaeon]MBT4669440.1 hypothetical protein [archaeon]MBT5029807.1 hypothetical protein [archaeon]MBT5288020.1 hypothetical protein [archaeon]
MKSKDLVSDLRLGKSVVYLKETYGQEFLEECGLGNLRRNHAWANRIENLNIVGKYLKKEEEVESLEYLVDTVRNVSWDQVRRIKNRDGVVNGIEKINQTYTRFLDKVYSQRNVEEIVEDNVLSLSRAEREVNDWYQGMLVVNNPSNYLRERLDELEDRGINTRVGREHAQSYLNEVSSKVDGNFVEKELINLVNVLEAFSRKWEVDYNEIVLPKKRSVKKIGLIGISALALLCTSVAVAQDYNWDVVKEGELVLEVAPKEKVEISLAVKRLELDEASPISYGNNNNVYFDWKDKRIDKKTVVSVDGDSVDFDELRKNLVDDNIFVIDENGKKVRNLSDGLKLNIKSANGNPLATDYGPCNTRWMFLVNEVYRCDVSPLDFFGV